MLDSYPADRDLLLIAAHSLRMIKQTEAALAMLDRLAEHHPRFSQMFLERGLCHVALRDDDPVHRQEIATALHERVARVAGHVAKGEHRYCHLGRRAAEAHRALQVSERQRRVQFGDQALRQAVARLP